MVVIYGTALTLFFWGDVLGILFCVLYAMFEFVFWPAILRFVLFLEDVKKVNCLITNFHGWKLFLPKILFFLDDGLQSINV